MAPLSFTLTEAVPVDWLQASPTDGTVDPDRAVSITVAIDPAGLEAGTHTTTLEIQSNDPSLPLLPIPVTLTVFLCDPITRATAAWEPYVPLKGENILLRASAHSERTVWTHHSIDQGGRGWYTALQLDPLDRPHIAYEFGRNLNYAYNNSTGWVTETVHDTDRAIGRFAAIALDETADPHIAYNGQGDGGLWYAHDQDGAWYSEKVQEGNTGLWPSLALSAGGSPQVAYYGNARENLRYASHDGADWQTESIETSGLVGAYPSMDLDSNGYPHVAYQYYGWPEVYTLRHAYFDGAEWITETVDSAPPSGTLRYISMAIDSQDQPQIAYFAGGELRYALHNGTHWTTETVAGPQAGYYASLALDEHGYPHISHWDYAQRELKHTYSNGTDWFSEIIYQSGSIEEMGGNTALAIDSFGQPHISYFVHANHTVKYSRFQSKAPSIPITYTWDLGDGTRATGEVISHTYDQAGLYTITLTATNRCGTAVSRYAISVHQHWQVYLPIIHLSRWPNHR
jgi:chitodextrinase